MRLGVPAAVRIWVRFEGLGLRVSGFRVAITVLSRAAESGSPQGEGVALKVPEAWIWVEIGESFGTLNPKP